MLESAEAYFIKCPLNLRFRKQKKKIAIAPIGLRDRRQNRSRFPHIHFASFVLKSGLHFSKNLILVLIVKLHLSFHILMILLINIKCPKIQRFIIFII